MTNKTHKLLTGADLHEPKGVATATSGQVYAADGAGSGSWAALGLSSLSSVAKAFQAGLLHVREQQPLGSAGNTALFTGANTRVLNTTVTNQITGATLVSNAISLPAGTYFTIGWAPARGVDGHRIFLYNNTDSTNLVLGTNAQSVGSDYHTHSFMAGQFTLAGTKSCLLRHIVTLGSTAAGASGKPISSGDNEIYAEVLIWKIG